MKCADIDVALSAMKARPGEPQKLTDERGAVVHSMYTELGFELKNMYGQVMPCAEEETRDFLSFMVGPVELEPLDPTNYVLETS